jgi:hypothetical protein
VGVIVTSDQSKSKSCYQLIGKEDPMYKREAQGKGQDSTFGQSSYLYDLRDDEAAPDSFLCKSG